MVIQHNLPAMNSHRQLSINNAQTSKNLEKLSSGYKINRAADDAAGLAISEKMRGQIRGLSMATQNAENGVSLIQTAEGGLNETHAILQRMRELAVQSSNGTYDDEVDRANIAKEANALKSEIDRIASSTHYNGIKLLDGTMGGKKTDGNNNDAVLKSVYGGTTAPKGVIEVDAGGANADDFTAALAKLGLKDNEEVTATLTVSADGNVKALQIGDKTLIADGAGNFNVATDGGTVAIANVDTELTAGVISNITLKMKSGDQVDIEDEPGLLVAGNGSQLVMQIGANGSTDQRVGLHVANMSTGNLGTKESTEYNDSGTIADISVATRESANDAVKVIDAAINQVSGTRADLGALQNRLEHTINNLGVTRENLQAAESSIRDVDMAKEMMDFTKNNILVQASQAMLAQANQLPQGVLQLLK